VDLCGHATLAAAHVLYEHMGFAADKLIFASRSGELVVTRNGGQLTLDFPVDKFAQVAVTESMCHWVNQRPLEAFKGKTDYMLVFPAMSDIAHIQANMPVIEKLTEVRGVIVTAKGEGVDFVSRFFAPQSGIPEDPVTGSAHTTLTPYWSAKLGKKRLTALQLSARKGYLQCEDKGERIEISGKAKTFFSGKINLS
jgi:predicted PhzF superfamily epimerase YddE/YHI9